MKQKILIWHWRNNKELLNLGEHFTTLLVHYFGYETQHYDDIRERCGLKDFKFCLMVIGSELHKEQIDALVVPEVHVWGQGKGVSGEYYDFDIHNMPYSKKVKIFAVRGPYTARQLKLDPTIPQGDPAFLLPYLFPIQTSLGDGKIRYIPHHRNRCSIEEKLNLIGADEFVDIMIRRDLLFKTLRKITSSKFILTNSLHCAIICHSYSIPWALSLVDNEELNMPDKWRDVFEFIGIYGNFATVKNYKEGYQWWNDVAKNAKIPSLYPLINSFPYPIRSKKGKDTLEQIQKQK
jgi:hypothetical protein